MFPRAFMEEGYGEGYYARSHAVNKSEICFHTCRSANHSWNYWNCCGNYNSEKRTVTQLRAVQSILAQAIKAAEAEDGEVEGWGLKQDRSKEDAELIAEKLRKHMKVAHDCGTEPDTNGFCFPNTTYTYLNGNKSPNYANLDYYYKIVLNNGASIFIQSYLDNPDNDEGYINFNVDVNGPKPPNTVGKDLFDFNYSKGSVRPNGAPGSEDYGNCDKKKSGWGCAYYVLQTGKLLK